MDNSAQVNKKCESVVLNVLSTLNLSEEKDIKTSGYNISPQYRYPVYGGQPTITGYQVNQSYEIKVRDLDKISTVLSGLVTAGANEVNNLGLQIENPEELKSEARQLAIDDAKKKAKELEKQVGVRLGKIVNFSEGSNCSSLLNSFSKLSLILSYTDCKPILVQLL